MRVGRRAMLDWRLWVQDMRMRRRRGLELFLIY
jgi:hypothetical protein